MEDISKYLEELKSPDKYKRFNACNSLQQMNDIPEEAIRALMQAANDPDPLVAKEAKGALRVHKPDLDLPPEVDSKSSESSPNEKSSGANVLGYIFLVIGLYFTFRVLTDTDGLNFINYCFPALVFLILGISILALSKLSKRK